MKLFKYLCVAAAIALLPIQASAYSKLDKSTGATTTITYPHHEAHAGSRYRIVYSVVDLGDMTTPTDMITLTFVTPDTTKWCHMTFAAAASADSRVRLIEAATGGQASATGTKPIYNVNRNSPKTSSLIAYSDSNTAVMSYDATLATGGNTLYDRYIEGDRRVGSGDLGDRGEEILKQNTWYQLSIEGNNSDPATLEIDFYEHTDKH